MHATSTRHPIIIPASSPPFRPPESAASESAALAASRPPEGGEGEGGEGGEGGGVGGEGAVVGNVDVDVNKRFVVSYVS